MAACPVHLLVNAVSVVSAGTLLTPPHPTLDHLLSSVTFELSLRHLCISCSYCQATLLDYSFLPGCECRIHLCISSVTKHNNKVGVKYIELNEWMKDEIEHHSEIPWPSKSLIALKLLLPIIRPMMSWMYTHN